MTVTYSRPWKSRRSHKRNRRPGPFGMRELVLTMTAVDQLRSHPTKHNAPDIFRHINKDGLVFKFGVPGVYWALETLKISGLLWKQNIKDAHHTNANSCLVTAPDWRQALDSLKNQIF